MLCVCRGVYMCVCLVCFGISDAFVLLQGSGMNALVSFLQTSWCSCIRPVSPGSSVTMLTTSPKFQGEHLSCSPHPSLSAVALCRQLICPSGGSVVVRTSLPLIIMSQKTHWLCGISVGVRCHIARLCTVLKMDPA